MFGIWDEKEAKLLMLHSTIISENFTKIVELGNGEGFVCGVQNSMIMIIKYPELTPKVITKMKSKIFQFRK